MAADGEQHALRTGHLLQRASAYDAGAELRKRMERWKVYQPAANAVASTPQEAAELLERRRQEA
eukprot:3914526-Prymnesium_polylepis.1